MDWLEAYVNLLVCDGQPNVAGIAMVLPVSNAVRIAQGLPPMTLLEAVEVTRNAIASGDLARQVEELWILKTVEEVCNPHE